MRRAPAALSLAFALCAVAAWCEEPVQVSVWAVHATSEGKNEKSFDASLAELKQILSPLPFDTFKEVKKYEDKSLDLGKKASFAIDDRYTLKITPTQREADGRVRMQVDVEMRSGKNEKPMNALSATLVVQLQDKIKLQGLVADQGEIIIVFEAHQ